MEDYYQTLGVERNATEAEIKTAYRKLANQHHPDKGGDEEKFKQIQIAYSILGDPERKGAYDNPQPGSPWWNAGGHGQQMPNFDFRSDNFHEVFQHFFGGPGPVDPFNIFGQRQPVRNKTINLTTQITLLEAFQGKELIADLQLPSGSKQTINVKIPPGINAGTTLRLAGLGENEFPHLPRGDIHLTVHIIPHPEFARQGDDLVKIIQVSCIEAMLGCKIDVLTIDGKTLEVKVEPGIQHDQVLSAQGYGMPNMNDPRLKGRLLMPIKIVVPTNITQKQRTLLNQFHLP
jgi:curved DNA-binding protein